MARRHTIAWGLLAAAACSPPDPETHPEGATPGVAAPKEAPARAAPSEDVVPGALDPAAAREVARATAGDAARAPESIDWSGGDAAAGSELYQGHCAVCHGASGRGDGLAAAALNPKPRDFSDGTFYLDGNANNRTGEPVDLARVIRDGPAAFGGSMGMQAWGEVFSDDEIRDLVAFIQELSGGDPEADDPG